MRYCNSLPGRHVAPQHPAALGYLTPCYSLKLPVDCEIANRQGELIRVVESGDSRYIKDLIASPRLRLPRETTHPALNAFNMRPYLWIGTLTAAALGAQAANFPIRNVYTFPNNTFIENIAVRSNSHLLVTSLSVPDLFAIDPSAASPTASVVHTFPNASGLMGITEVKPDVFALVSGIWDLANTRAQLGSLAVWTIDLTGASPVVSLVTSIQNSTIFNGLARHPTNPRLLLAADSAIGAVWRVNLKTGAYSVAFSSPLLAPTGTAPGTNLGINGLKALGSHVYFTNSAQGFFGKVPIDGQGNQAGTISVISNSTGAGADVVYDDFALDKKLTGTGAWIASHPSYAVRVAPNGSQYAVNDTTKLPNPTSAALGRGSFVQEKTLYITNGGRFVLTDTGFDLVDGGVVAIDLI